MATLLIKNNTAGELFIADVGTNIPASGQVLVNDIRTLLAFAQSESLRGLVIANTVTLNDGSSDLSQAQAEQFLQSLWSSAGTSPIPLAPPGFIFNARLTWVSVSVVKAGTLNQRSVVTTQDGSGIIIWKGELSADITLSGPGGRQTGSALNPNQWYRVLVIGDSSGTNSPTTLFVQNGTPFNQAGYDIARRIGFVRVNGASEILKFFQGGDGNTRFIYYDMPAASLVVLANGAAVAFTDISLTNLIPPIGRTLVTFGLAFTNVGSAAGDEVSLRPKGSTVSAVATRLAPGIVLTSKMKLNIQMFCDDAQLIQYQVTNAADRVDVAVAGYNDEL